MSPIHAVRRLVVPLVTSQEADFSTCVVLMMFWWPSEKWSKWKQQWKDGPSSVAWRWLTGRRHSPFFEFGWLPYNCFKDCFCALFQQWEIKGTDNDQIPALTVWLWLLALLSRFEKYLKETSAQRRLPRESSLAWAWFNRAVCYTIQEQINTRT